jgi:acylphosphatase
MDEVRLVAFVRGHVQGVGFRWWTRSQALALGLSGYAKNLPDGRVEVQAQGPRGQVEKLLERLTADEHVGRPGRVRGVTHHWLDPVDVGRGFFES